MTATVPPTFVNLLGEQDDVLYVNAARQMKPLLSGSRTDVGAEKVQAGKLQLPAVGYIALVVFMAAAACSAAVRGFSVGLLLFAAGGICFAVSDNLLCAYCFGTGRSRSVDRAVHISYYAAQLLIAWSLRFL